jgi:predicted small lipoprotein YifL
VRRGLVGVLALALAVAAACGKVGPPVRRPAEPAPPAAAGPDEEREDEEHGP